MADAPCAEVSLNVLHLRVDDLAIVAGGVQHVSVAAVHSHLGYGVPPTVLLEEDQVTLLEVAPGDPLAVPLPILSDRMIRQPLAEAPEDELCKARAVFLTVSPARRGRREAVAGAEVLPALPYHGPALPTGARGGVIILARTRGGPAVGRAAFGWRKVLGRRGSDTPDERNSVGDDLARAAV